MNFTREPIIETIITPKDGFKLVVRNSKVAGAEEYSVDAVEVISFGSAMFYRSLEKPKSFLLPVTDFEVVEMRETKVNLKSVNIDKAIKIASPKEGGTRPLEQRSQQGNQQQGQKQEGQEGGGNSASPLDNKRKKRSRKKRGQERKEESKETSSPSSSKELEVGEGVPAATYSHVKRLIPPPSTLISETISRYKSIPSSDAEGFVDDIGVAAPIIGKEGIEEELITAPSPSFEETDFDAIWMQETPHFDEEEGYFDGGEEAKEPIKFAKAEESDEPIGKTHIEEALPDEDEL